MASDLEPTFKMMQHEVKRGNAVNALDRITGFCVDQDKETQRDRELLIFRDFPYLIKNFATTIENE